jgi:protocatechuate 3,4-dioxygenase beta subunit
MKRSWLFLILALIGAAGPATADEADGKQGPAARAAISGTVHDAEGRPVVGATVQIHSADVRGGTNLFCPTCYADCGKRAKTDKEGHFAIKSLDPTLVFRLLVIAEGYEPKAVAKVDPQTVGRIDTRLTPREMPSDPACIVRGVVIDPTGKPAIGALVEPYGCKAGERHWYGSMPGVDPMTLTDDAGKFAIVCAKPVEGLDLLVRAEGALRANFVLVSSGEEEHRLTLQTGTTVEGRVVKDRQGVSKVTVGLVQVKRSLERHLGSWTIRTDSDGRFSLPNLPADEDLLVYGLIDSLQGKEDEDPFVYRLINNLRGRVDGGVVVARQFKSAKEGTFDLGDLPVVQGRAELAAARYQFLVWKRDSLRSGIQRATDR